jgi:hypothetical protein
MVISKKNPKRKAVLTNRQKKMKINQMIVQNWIREERKPHRMSYKL